VRAILGECPGHFERGDVLLDWALILTYKDGHTWTMDNSVEGNVRRGLDSSWDDGFSVGRVEIFNSDGSHSLVFL